MNDINMLVWPISINNYPIFLLDILLCSVLMIQIFKRLPPCKWLEWTGSHSLVYYFLCGGVPLITSRVFERIGLSYHGNYLIRDSSIHHRIYNNNHPNMVHLQIFTFYNRKEI